MKYKIVTLGCKVNSYESSYFANALSNNGYEMASNNEDCDIVIINTCTVTSTSDAKSRQMIHREHKKYPHAIMVVTGCYSQVFSDIVKDIEGVNIVIGSKYKDKLINLINEFKHNKKQIVKVDNIKDIKEYEDISVSKYEENTRAFIKIQDGCNNYCSYCLIPLARGRSRSRNKDSIINEIKYLVDHDYKEIVLTGIDTAWYGTDLSNYNFIKLLKDILKEVPKLERIRISSIEERQINDEFIELIKNEPKILPHLHIPLQSGSETVLERMKRKYNLKMYQKILEKLRLANKNISITTDVIVGFPGETEKEFKETYKFIKKSKFSMLHVFPYSRRSGTIADKMPNQVDEKIKRERVTSLIKLGDKLSNKYISKFKNKCVNVLFEQIKDGYIVGHADNYFLVMAKGSKEDLNKIKKVKILKAGYPNSFGVIIR